MVKKKKNAAAQHTLRPTTIKIIEIILLIAFALFTALSGIGKAGGAGEYMFRQLSSWLGIAYAIVPLMLGAAAFVLIRSSYADTRPSWLKIVAVFLLMISVLGIVGIFNAARAGSMGNAVAGFFISFFDRPGSIVMLVAFALISFLVIFETFMPFGALARFFRSLAHFMRPALKTEEIVAGENNISSASDSEINNEEKEIRAPETSVPITTPEEDGWQPKKKWPRARFGAYEPPPLSFLEHDMDKPDVGDIQANAAIVKRTLRNFGIQVEMDEVSVGPSVTRYALKPAEGVKLTAIVARQNDLALALAAHSIRIEAPIPGRSLVGIEIPNAARATVPLGGLLGSGEFASSDKNLLFALGKSVAGKLHFGNLAKMPHLLIAGATGSGKSVAIHALITSLIYRNSPEDLRFIFIDPKRVELTLWSGIPHLATTVITDAKRAIQALRWAAKEMDRRYDILEMESVRDIDSYHKNIVQAAPKNSVNLPDPMPYLVIVIDELADIMSLYPRELEAAIVRLAQMSRAVGIHLVLSTQRPSVNVITGLIKANIPSRIALQVVSQIDSRTILDTGGAEKLLGSGDLLYLGGERAKPERIQSAYISEGEVKKIAQYLAKKYPDEGGGDLLPSPESLAESASQNEYDDKSDGDEEDELYAAAKEAVEKAGKGSTSYLQRRLRIGYARAARLMDILEERGVIGPADGAKPREVLHNALETAIATLPTTETSGEGDGVPPLV